MVMRAVERAGFYVWGLGRAVVVCVLVLRGLRGGRVDCAGLGSEEGGGCVVGWGDWGGIDVGFGVGGVTW